MQTRRSNTIGSAAILAAVAAVATPAYAEQFTDFARVRSVTPEYERVNTPREECRTEYIPGAARPAERGNAGAIIGGVAGAVIGGQVGKGSGNKAAIAAGAITGAIVGDRMQNESPAYADAGREVRRCNRVDNWENRFTGYRVVYEYGGRQFTTVTPQDPGREMRVRVSVEPEAVTSSNRSSYEGHSSSHVSHGTGHSRSHSYGY